MSTILVFLTFVSSALITYLVRRLAVRRGMLDVPNARSSHTVPTPRGGGLGIVISTLAGWAVLAILGVLQLKLFAALSVGGIIVATVGFVDDRKSLSARVRLAAHTLAALCAVVILGGFPAADVAGGSGITVWVGYPVCMLGIIWALNLFNFMDGIDGIAGSEGLFVAAAGALLALFAGISAGLPEAALVLAAACLGFLLWNWPPARIFLGDVGSAYIGYAVAVLALSAWHQSRGALSLWWILSGLFFVDATVTVLRRIVAGHRVYQAHRTHAYQLLALRWKSHTRVTWASWGINVLWLFPCATLAMQIPAYSPLIVVAALLPLASVCILVGAGKATGPVS